MKNLQQLELELLNEEFLIGKTIGDLDFHEDMRQNFLCLIKNNQSNTIICSIENQPKNLTNISKNWRAFFIKAQLDFSLSGILVSVLNPLSKAGISVFVSSNFDTDYIFVKEEYLQLAINELSNAGYILHIRRN